MTPTCIEHRGRVTAGLDDHAALLRGHVSEDRRADFDRHIAWLIKNDEWYSIDASYLGFMDDYVNIASLVERKVVINDFQFPFGDTPRPKNPPITVYDVGCATALQHVLFDPRSHYVGIDIGGKAPDPVFFRDHCRFIRGRFANVIGSLDIDRERAIGVANMSLLYHAGPEELALFDRTFRRKIIL